MKSLCILVISLAVISIDGLPQLAPLRDIGGRIISGYEAAPGQFPWQVAIDLGINGFCGGSLINDRWVLTAAHCFDIETPSTVMLGLTNLSNPYAVTRNVIKTIIHKDYHNGSLDNGTLHNDIALLELSYPVEFSECIQPITLTEETDKLPGGVVVTVTGWGYTSDDLLEVSEVLNYVQLITMENEHCMEYYPVTRTEVCTMGVGKKNICGGDDGGPVTIRSANGITTLVAVVSAGESPCEILKPSGHTRVAPYRRWITQFTKV